jgi:type II secretory ATPase GspE/PulE/Tfp pilus assembly ATPase PilB-like protein
MNPFVRATDLTINVYDLPPEQAVARLLDFAAQNKASDLLFATEEYGVSVSIRHLGIHRLVTQLSADFGRHCVAYIKAAANMDFVEHRKPQDGRWLHLGPDGQVIDLRISILPTLHGEDFNLRMLNRQSHFVALEKLGMISYVLGQFQEIIESPSGLVLVTGPTGAGKTTTLYAALQHLNQGLRKINTVEDPIEYALSGIRQSQINMHVDLDFPELLRAVLRQAPDVIMIGEIRDPVTAETAVRAANSGHLVLATLHAPGAAAAIHSLQTFGVLPYFLGPSLSCVLSQRLVRTLCPECREIGGELTWPQLFDDVAYLRAPDAPRNIFSARGCPKCHQTGYVSRTGIFENLVVTNKLRHLIYEKGTAGEIYRQALQDAMISFRSAAMLKIAAGETSAEEVRRVFPVEFLQS